MSPSTVTSPEYYYTLHHLTAFSRTTLVTLGSSEGGTILDFNEARDDGVAVVSAGQYANHLHLAADR